MNQIDTNHVDKILEKLREEYGYSMDSIRRYVSLSKGQARYKADMIVYAHGKPFIVIELKYPLKGVTFEALEQLKQHMSASKAKYGVITDGIILFCYMAEETQAGIALEKIPDIPQADLADKKPLLKELNSKYLQDIVWNEFDYLRGKTTSKVTAVLGISKIIAAKLYDEKEGETNSRFYSNPDEDAETVKSRLESILLNISKKFGLISHEIELDASLVKDIVIRLQKYSISNSELIKDGLSTLYPMIMNERELGELITPRNLIKFSIEIAGIHRNQAVFDPACGLGGFLVEASKYGAQIFGVDINQKVVEIAKINMYLIGSNPLNIICHDSLQFYKKNNADLEVPHQQYDLFITNPPFNYKIQDERLDLYHLTKISGGFSESLFVELGAELVKNNGKIIIIVPEGFLFNSQNERVRDFLLKNFKIAVISLPAKMFPSSAIRTSILVLTKTKPDSNQSIFLAKVRPVEVKKNVAEQFDQQFKKILTAYREYEQHNTVNRYFENIILAKVVDSRRLDYDFYEKESLEKFTYETKLLGDIAELQVGLKAEHLEDKTGEFEVFPVSGQNIKDFIVDSSLILPIKIDRELNYKHIAERYDILMTRSGNPGKVGMVVRENIPILVKDNLIRIRPNKNIIDPYYLFAFLSSIEGQDILQKLSTGSAVKAINLQNLSTLKIPMPPLDEQRKIADELMKLLELKNEIKSLMNETEKRKELVEERIGNLFQRRKRR